MHLMLVHHQAAVNPRGWSVSKGSDLVLPQAVKDSVKGMELMAEGQWKRWDAVARSGAGKLTVQEAVQVLGLSVRQVRRIRQAVARAGRAGLQHGRGGQSAPAFLARLLRHDVPPRAPRARFCPAVS